MYSYPHMSPLMYIYRSTDTNMEPHALDKCHTCSVAILEVIINKSKLHRRAHYVHQLWLNCHSWGNPVYSSHLNHVWLLSGMCDYGTLYSLREHEQQSKDAQFLQCTTRICGQTQCKVTSLGIEHDMQGILTILRQSIVVVLVAVCSTTQWRRSAIILLKQWTNSLVRQRKP